MTSRRQAPEILITVARSLVTFCNVYNGACSVQSAHSSKTSIAIGKINRLRTNDLYVRVCESMSWSWLFSLVYRFIDYWGVKEIMIFVRELRIIGKWRTKMFFSRVVQLFTPYNLAAQSISSPLTYQLCITRARKAHTFFSVSLTDI